MPTTEIKRPPCAVMSVSAVTQMDVDAINKLCQAGFEVVVIQDENFEACLKIIEEIRKPSISVPFTV